MAEIEIGEIVIEENGAVKMVMKANDHENIMISNIRLWQEDHPELEVHCDAIRLYMKQEARRLLGE